MGKNGLLLTRWEGPGAGGAAGLLSMGGGETVARYFQHLKLPSRVSCASCAARPKGAQARSCVATAEVNLATETATVSMAEGAPPQSLVEAVRAAGYEARLSPAASPAKDRSWWPVAFATALTLPLIVPMLAGFTDVDWMLPGWLQCCRDAGQFGWCARFIGG